MAETLRLMAVHAHPDDESSKGAASMARYAAEGVEVLVVSCTGGERGDVLNPRLQGDPRMLRDMAEYRRREMAEAARVLGVQHRWLGYVDSGLPEGDPLPPLPAGCFALEPEEFTVNALVHVVREFRPHVMTTYDESGGYPHPDHIMCHRVSRAAFDAAADPARFPLAGEAWRTSKLYYHANFSRARMTAFHEALLARGLESPYGEWIERVEKMEADPTAPKRVELEITTRVECADFFETRDRALLAHATQIDPDGFFFGVPLEMQRELWPTEDYHLAVSHVPTEVPEDDLFAGLRERGPA
ncbi:mycothiol conjugate amidase Mca [Paenibacillus sp. TRM 82003]|uniref:mycothiol conjugate amidase Mca n=1 Tax=Kineococcus sp. TRM81007 TaxID=2925831 RepID=UPI001F56977C|nr:mycothiol conjugate amidase Mca [Kineococcus sp. TRM81007]MCI2238371.1 mycothiol conjugate amidase Mca [Kineococcus sp. TRM81007]MCI3922115.1 mycothiol conjugate amidase Mca [Paenibacillus sp. TRM 82003]